MPPGTASRQEDFGPENSGDGADAALPRHAAPEGSDAPAADAPPAPPQAQVAEVDDAPAAPMAADEPLRVGHDDADEYEKLVTDPEAAAEATKARMDAQAEAEKAAAGITRRGRILTFAPAGLVRRTMAG